MLYLSVLFTTGFKPWYNMHMIDHDTIKAIQADMKLIEPLADIRRYKQRVKRQKSMNAYAEAYYHRNKQAINDKRVYDYEPVIQSPVELTPDELNDL